MSYKFAELSQDTWVQGHNFSKAVAYSVGDVSSLVLYVQCLLESLKMVLQALLKDSDFQIPSESGKEAHLAASEMLEWLATRDNAALAIPISQRIMAALSKCIPQGSTLSRAKCERMWVKFYHTRTSTELKELWIHLMQLSICKSASPISTNTSQTHCSRL